MYDTLSERLSGVFDKLTKHAVLSQDDVAACAILVPPEFQSG